MARTPSAPARVTAPTQAPQPRLTKRLLAGLEWGLLLAALGLWAGGRAGYPAVALGAGLLAAAWLARRLRTGRGPRVAALNLAVGVFVLSGVAGLWAAPNPGPALAQLSFLVGAAGLYYALAASEGQALTWAAVGLALAGAGVSVYFLAASLGPNRPNLNVIAACLAVCAPVAVALLTDMRRQRLAGGLAGAALLVMVPALVLTESRTTWLALAGALGLAGWWWLAGRLAPQRRLPLFWAVAGLGALAGLGVVVTQLQGVNRALGLLPGSADTAMHRLYLYGQAWRLAQATPLTGGGLGSFPALYSTYMLDLPVPMLAHAHNAYLNVLVEQGWPGLAALVGVLAVGAWAATRALAVPAVPNTSRGLLAAGAVGLAVVALHGLGDGTLVASPATFFLWVPAGLVAAARPSRSARRPAHERRGRVIAAGLLGGALLVAVLAGRPLAAAWHANLGAVTAARIELAGWPTGKWGDRTLAAALEAARPEFEAALALDPDNLAAHYHLGRQARLAHHFDLAAQHLAHAAALDPGHRGLMKTLGLTYVWLGDLQAAQPLLAAIPEARSELEVYHGWWAEQGRPDLADNALRMRRQLAP